MCFIKIITTSKRFVACITFMFCCLVNHFNILRNFKNLSSALSFNPFFQFNNFLSLLPRVCLQLSDIVEHLSISPSASLSSMYDIDLTSAINYRLFFFQCEVSYCLVLMVTKNNCLNLGIILSRSFQQSCLAPNWPGLNCAAPAATPGPMHLSTTLQILPHKSKTQKAWSLFFFIPRKV